MTTAQGDSRQFAGRGRSSTARRAANSAANCCSACGRSTGPASTGIGPGWRRARAAVVDSITVSSWYTKGFVQDCTEREQVGGVAGPGGQRRCMVPGRGRHSGAGEVGHFPAVRQRGRGRPQVPQRSRCGCAGVAAGWQPSGEPPGQRRRPRHGQRRRGGRRPDRAGSADGPATGPACADRVGRVQHRPQRAVDDGRSLPTDPAEHPGDQDLGQAGVPEGDRGLPEPGQQRMQLRRLRRRSVSAGRHRRSAAIRRDRSGSAAPSTGRRPGSATARIPRCSSSVTVHGGAQQTATEGQVPGRQCAHVPAQRRSPGVG